MKTFFVMGLPRSGTAWLSNFLTWGDSFCLHEATCGCESLQDLEDAFIRTGCSNVGNADTASVILADALDERFPDSRFLFVVRNIDKVKYSLRTKGFDNSFVDSAAVVLSTAIREESLNSMAVSFESLFEQNTARAIWDFLRMPGDFPFRRFELLRGARIDSMNKFNPQTPLAREALRLQVKTFENLVKSVSEKSHVPSQRSRA